jgi:hypothetical protein
MRLLRVMTDYDCDPIWEVLPSGLKNVDPGTLPISEELVDRIDAWRTAYDATLDQNDPTRSGFLSVDAENAFEAEGMSIWRALRAELGSDYDVSYFSQTKGRLIATEQ